MLVCMCIWLFYISFSNKIYLFIYFVFLLQFGVGTFYGRCRNAGNENPTEPVDSWIAPESAADSDLEVEDPDSDIDDPSFYPDEDSIIEDEDLHEPSTSSGVSSKRG